MKPLFKVGDRVTVLDTNYGDSRKFQHSFLDTMVAECGGKTYTIEKVQECQSEIRDERWLPDDNAVYTLVGTTWSFASSMFKESSDKQITKDLPWT